MVKVLFWTQQYLGSRQYLQFVVIYHVKSRYTSNILTRDLLLKCKYGFDFAKSLKFAKNIELEL